MGETDKNKKWTADELADKIEHDNAHLVIHGKVYAVSKFLDEHPGGDEVMLGEAGAKDASEAFEDVGHSDEARGLLDGFLVGICEEKDLNSKERVPTKARVAAKKSDAGQYVALRLTVADARRFNYLLPLAALVLYMSYRYYQQNFA